MIVFSCEWCEFTAKTFCAYGLLHNYKRKKGWPYKRRKKKRVKSYNFYFLFFPKKPEKSENETILYNIDKVVKNVLAKNRGKNEKKIIFIYFSFFVYGIGLHCPNKRKKGEWNIE